MSEMLYKWNGNGVADGVAVISGNVNAAGNGATVALGTAGTRTAVYEGQGFRVADSAADGVCRIDSPAGSFSSRGVRGQMMMTIGAFHTNVVQLMVGRAAGANAARVEMAGGTSKFIRAGYVSGTGTACPALLEGDQILIDWWASLHTAPTTSNGRVAFRIKNLSRPTWNTTGEFFFDSGWTVNLGTANFDAHRGGYIGGGVLASPGILYEHIGWEPIAPLVADTSEAAAKAYFADNPTLAATPLPTPTLTLTGSTDATTVGGTNGTATVTFNESALRAAGATSFVAEKAPGAGATTGFTVVSTSATSPFTFTGLAGGDPDIDYTLAITAVP